VSTFDGDGGEGDLDDGAVDGAAVDGGAVDPGAVFRIDDGARRASTTVRNVRAYQDRGLLPPPRRAGRVGLYSASHLARLQLIGELLTRGYTLANIAELVVGWERGQDLSELLGLEAVLFGPWSDDRPATVAAVDLEALLGRMPTAGQLRLAVEVGLLEPDGDRYRIPNARMLDAASVLVRAGVPIEAVFAAGASVAAAVDAIAAGFVALVVDHVVEPLGETFGPDDVHKLAELVRQMQPLAKVIVDTELARSMERRIQAEVGERISRASGRPALTEGSPARASG
jgi:DNA-binding transcriptional MerR regulator